MKENFEIIVYGRGGQGAKTCAQLIAESALIDEKYIQAFPEYGPERRGAPVRSFVRISDKPIRIHEPISNPDVVMVLDDKLFNSISNLKDFNCAYIINTKKSKEDFKDLRNKEIYTIDGSSISQELIKINNPSTALIGMLIKITNIVTLDAVKNIIKKEFEKKGKLEIIEPNIKCLEKGHNY